MTLSPWRFNDGKTYLMPERNEKRNLRFLSGISIQLNTRHASMCIHLVVGFHCVEENLDCYCVCCLSLKVFSSLFKSFTGMEVTSLIGLILSCFSQNLDCLSQGKKNVFGK